MFALAIIIVNFAGAYYRRQDRKEKKRIRHSNPPRAVMLYRKGQARPVLFCLH